MTQIELICQHIGCKPDKLPKVTTLDARGCTEITDAGLAHVPKLTTLDAMGNGRH